MIQNIFPNFFTSISEAAPWQSPKVGWGADELKKKLYWADTGEIINSIDMRTNLHRWTSTTKMWFLALEELYKSFYFSVRINWMKICLIYIVFVIHVQSFGSFITQVYAYSNYLSREKKYVLPLLQFLWNHYTERFSDRMKVLLRVKWLKIMVKNPPKYF